MKLVLAILLVVLALLQVRLWVGPGSISDIARLENAIDAQYDENASLEARNAALMDEVSDLRNGLDSIEERARNELGLIRRGETFYLIVDEDPANRRPAPPESAQQLAPETVTPAPLPEAVIPAALPEAALPEALPETTAEENPYLEIFRDEADASDTESAAATAAGR